LSRKKIGLPLEIAKISSLSLKESDLPWAPCPNRALKHKNNPEMIKIKQGGG
jgi:hypothetical protein